MDIGVVSDLLVDVVVEALKGGVIPEFPQAELIGLDVGLVLKMFEGDLRVDGVEEDAEACFVVHLDFDLLEFFFLEVDL